MQVGAQTVETTTDGHSTPDNPFLPGHLRSRAVSAAAGAPQAGAPPLKPTLKLYRELYRMGFGVTFITGRQAQSAPPGPGLFASEMQRQILVHTLQSRHTVCCVLALHDKLALN